MPALRNGMGMPFLRKVNDQIISPLLRRGGVSFHAQLHGGFHDQWRRIGQIDPGAHET